jgi:hypothetical protein
MHLVLLLLRPPTLLPIRRHLEREPAHPQRETQHVRGEDPARGGRQRGEGTGGDGVDGEDGHQAEGDPEGLGEEGGCELGGAVADGVEAGVAAFAEDALEEVGADWTYTLAPSLLLHMAPPPIRRPIL